MIEASDLQMVQKFESMRKLLDVMYVQLPLGVEVKDVSSGAMAESAGLHPQRGAKYVADFIDLGIVRREGPEYGNPTNGLSPGRHYHYTLLVDKNEAIKRFEDWATASAAESSEKRKEGAARGAAKRAESILVAEAGEDRANGLAAHVDTTTMTRLQEARRDEPGALIEAARQYARRDDRLDGMVADMERAAAEMGIPFDREAAFGLFTVERDEFLETITLVLPYVDRLERENERLKGALNSAQTGKSH